MTNKCMLLLKLQLTGILGINKILYSNDRKEKRKMQLICFGMILLCIMMLVYSGSFAIISLQLGMVSLIPQFVLVICGIGTLIFTFLKSNGLLFGNKDYDMIMSLPVNSSIIIASRILSGYIVNFIFVVIAMLPSIIVYGVSVKVSLSVWVMLIISIFLAPVFPMVIAMTMGALITIISIKFKYKNLITIALNVIGVFAIIGFSFSLQIGGATEVTNIGNVIADKINKFYPIAGIFTNALENESWVSFILFILISLGAVIIFVLILSVNYSKINTKLNSHHSKINYKFEELKSSSVFRAVYNKEVKQYFYYPIYVLNTSISILIPVVVSIVLIFISPKQMIFILGYGSEFDILVKLMPLIIAAFASICSTTSVSMSLEGKNRWILYSSPIEPITIFKAKIALNLTIIVPAVIICSSLFAISLSVGITDVIMMFVTPIVYCMFTVVTGLFINLKLPKYEWVSEYNVIKQSVSGTISIFLGIFSAGIPIGIGFMFNDSILTILIVTTLVIAGSTIFAYRSLKKVKLFL